MNTPYTDSNACPSPDALLRCRDGYSAAEEETAVTRHLERCEDCRTDFESTRFLAVEMLRADAAREELAGFAPSSEHAWACHELTDALSQLARAAAPPTGAAGAHLHSCAYCRERLALLAPARLGAGRPTLRDQILGAMLEESLLAAEKNVLRAILWKRAAAALATAVQPIRVWLDESRRVCTEGLRVLMRPEAPAMAVARTMPGVGEEQWLLLEGERTWLLPVTEHDCIVTLRIRPTESPATWEVRCEATSPGDPAIAEQTWLEVRGRDSLPEYSVSLADLAAAGPITLATGRYELRWRWGSDVRTLSLQLG
jgi:hypothetical protein